MLADFFTKPVQGGQFKQLRDQIMGITAIPIEERVVDHSRNNDVPKKLTIGIAGDKREPVKSKTYAEIVMKPNDDVYGGRKCTNEKEKKMTQHSKIFSKK